MFKFLKEKLNSVVKKFSKDVEEESEKIEIKEDVTKNESENKVEGKKEKEHVEKNEKGVSIEKSKKKEKDTKKEEPSKKIPEKKEETKLKSLEKKEITKNKEKESEYVRKEKEKEKIIDDEKKQVEKEEEIAEKKEEHKGLFSRIFRQKEKLEEKEKPEVGKKETKKNKDSIDITKEELEDDYVEAGELEYSKDSYVHESKYFEHKKDEVEELDSTKKDVKREEIGEDINEEENIKEKKGFFSKITDTFTKINLSEEKFEELFWELEVMLLENNVAVEVIQKIKEDLKKELMSGKISRKNVDEIIKDSLKKSLEEILDIKGFDLEDKIKNKKPYVIAVIGVNGSGKTTTIAKLCHLLKKQGHSVVLAAADTFRAAAIQQLEHHAEKLDVKIIKHDYNSDPAAVAFDAIRHAEAKKIDVVVIDTAGRLHSNDNLMNELKKLVKVNKPDLKLFVGESITGNDCVEQAKVYDEIIGIDAIILSKADVDDKGGAALSISYVTKKPVLFIGTGQTYDDLKEFNREEILEGLGF